MSNKTKIGYYLGSVRLDSAPNHIGKGVKEVLIPRDKPTPPKRALGFLHAAYLKVVEKEVPTEEERNDVFCFVPYLPIGCLFDGAHGQEYNDNRVIELAKEYGWVDAEEGLGRVDHLEEIEQTDPDELRQYQVEDATTYLEDFAPEGHWVGWYEGDFGVWPEDGGDDYPAED
jgi:hypothetical protein